MWLIESTLIWPATNGTPNEGQAEGQGWLSESFLVNL